MQKIVNNTSVDTKSSIHASIIDAAILNETNIFGAAIMLDGTDDWIDLGSWSINILYGETEHMH